MLLRKKYFTLNIMVIKGTSNGLDVLNLINGFYVFHVWLISDPISRIELWYWFFHNKLNVSPLC